MTKILNFGLKIKGGGREGGTCESSDPATPSKFETCTGYSGPDACGLTQAQTYSIGQCKIEASLNW